MTSTSPDDPARRLSIANRILSAHGVLDAFGHVSMRHPDRPDRFLLARNMAPAQVAPGDVLEFDLEGFSDDDRRPYLERFIHSAAYSARPDICAVVHSHSPAIIPFTVVDTPLRPVFHMAGFLAYGVGRFEAREQIGDGSDLLVRDQATGLKLAEMLGGGALVMMRGHGSTVVGDSLEDAVYRAVYAEANARIQAQAMGLGEVTFLDEDEGIAAAVANAGQVRRAWDLWEQQAGG